VLQSILIFNLGTSTGGHKMGKSIIFLYSYHHHNTQKIGNAIAAKINASIIDIGKNIESVEWETYDLAGL
jgi:flavodoxin